MMNASDAFAACYGEAYIPCRLSLTGRENRLPRGCALRQAASK